MRRLSCLFLVCLLACASAGCGKEKEPIVTHPVSGRVLYAGKAAEGVKVYFYPTSAPMVPDIPANPHGVTDRDGRFTLTTFTPGDGAPEGGYQVVLLWPPAASEEGEEVTGDRLLGWYSAVHSTLTAQVKGGDNTFPPFHLRTVTRPPEVSQGVPGRN
jgi:hypothetical protein